MKDRVPVNPGRVLITPENGPAYYATMTRADNPTQNGTPLNKASLLKDATAALFGLGVNAVPDDVFNVLSRFQNGLGNEYVWSKAGLSIVANELIKKLKISVGSETVQYSSTCAISGTSVVLTGDVQTKAVNYGENHSWLTGKYFIPSYGDYAGQVLYSTVSPYEDSASPGWIFTDATLVKVNVDSLSYVNSPYANAYPIDDGFTYTALGQLGNMVRIATGSYTGTGTYGSGNPNSLTLEKVPKFLIITISTGTKIATLVPGTTKAVSIQVSASRTGSLDVSWNGATVTWYGSDEVEQFNISGVEYMYWALV